MAFGANDYPQAGIDADRPTAVIWPSLITGAWVCMVIDANAYPTG